MLSALIGTYLRTSFHERSSEIRFVTKMFFWVWYFQWNIWYSSHHIRGHSG